ncbi:MAG: hypothetical protein HWN66_11420 [Candidatus Helarchaeota archaeon]|nr:hypothetical protein [Candidatus Helarchaeota archaeon]
MENIWDIKADAVSEGDNLRDVRPLKKYQDRVGTTYYVFSKAMFHNPRYIIPKDNFTLFYNFLNGGSREYPSDGNIPVDIGANKAKIVLKRLKDIAEDPSQKFHSSAKQVLVNGELDLVRGTIKLYLGECTTRDWRRKRSTDDIDFWISDHILLEHILSDLGWIKNKTTREWEKKVTWTDAWTGRMKSEVLIASNDKVQGMDFGSGSYLEGSNLKAIIKKKLTRGHDVDLSDIINVAIVNKIPESRNKNSPWSAFEEAANLRHRRVNSNLISFSRYAHGVADYLGRVSESIALFKGLVKHQFYIPDQNIMKICKISSHWLSTQIPDGADATRQRIYSNLARQQRKKLQYSVNLRDVAYRVIELLNSKHIDIVFEIEE